MKVSAGIERERIVAYLREQAQAWLREAEEHKSDPLTAAYESLRSNAAVMSINAEKIERGWHWQGTSTPGGTQGD